MANETIEGMSTLRKKPHARQEPCGRVQRETEAGKEEGMISDNEKFVRENWVGQDPIEVLLIDDPMPEFCSASVRIRGFGPCFYRSTQEEAWAAAAGISPEGKRGVQKGAAGDHGKLLRGQSVSGAAAAKAGVGGAVRDAGFQAGDGKFMGTGKCPHGWSNWLICAECNPKGDK